MIKKLKNKTIKNIGICLLLITGFVFYSQSMVINKIEAEALILEEIDLTKSFAYQSSNS